MPACSSAARSRWTTFPGLQRPRGRWDSSSEARAGPVLGTAAARLGVLRRAGVGPLPQLARGEHGLRIGRLATAAVVAAQGHEQVAALALQVVAQDHASE